MEANTWHIIAIAIEHKKLARWTSSVPFDDVEKLFGFIRSWSRFFKGSKEKFREIYWKIYFAIKRL
jgi:hypothetical protein